MCDVTHERVISCMNESCHTWMSRVTWVWLQSVNFVMPVKKRYTFSYGTFKWVMSHMNESCHIWMSRVTHSVMSHLNESCHTWMRHVSYQWVMSHMNQSCHISMGFVTHEWVMSHINESCHTLSYVTYQWVLSHKKWVMSHINESYHTWMSHDTWVKVQLVDVVMPFQKCLKPYGMTHSCVTWLIAHCTWMSRCLWGWLRLVGSLKL